LAFFDAVSSMKEGANKDAESAFLFGAIKNADSAFLFFAVGVFDEERRFLCGWPIIIGLIHASELPEPLTGAKIGLDGFIRIPDEAAEEISIIYNSPIKNVFELKLDTKPDQNGPHIGVAFLQKLEQEHSRDHRACDMFMADRYAGAEEFPPVTAKLPCLRLRFGAKTDNLDSRIPNEVSGRGLSGIFCRDSNYWLRIFFQFGQASYSGYADENNVHVSDIDIGSDLCLADPARLCDLFFPRVFQPVSRLTQAVSERRNSYCGECGNNDPKAVKKLSNLNQREWNDLIGGTVFVIGLFCYFAYFVITRDERKQPDDVHNPNS
jgi:hypothetical protein